MVGIVVPMEKEGRGLIEGFLNRKRQQIAGRQVYCGQLSSLDCVLIVSGCGKVNSASATQLLVDRFHCSVIVHLGVAGALSSELKIGDFVIGESFEDLVLLARF